MKDFRRGMQTLGRRNWHPPDRDIQIGQWNGFGPYLQRLVDQGVGSKIDVPKSEVGELPSQFEPSPPPSSVAAGAKAVYREDRS